MTSSPLQGAPSHYWEVDVELAPEAEELWSLFCYDRGATGAQALEGNEENGENPERLTLRFFFGAEAPCGGEEWVEAFRREFPGVPPPFRIATRRRAVENWQENWRAHFVPTPAGRSFMICPPWDVPGVDALE